MSETATADYANISLVQKSRVPTRYYPLDYAANCKRNNGSGYSFLTDNVREDLTIILVAFVPLAPAPVATFFAIILFHISFWIIYEAGYVDNDRMAARAEVDAKIPPSFHLYDKIYNEPLAWICAIIVAIPAAFLAALSGVSFLPGSPLILTFAVLALWGLLLVSLRLLYMLYNRIDKMSRIYLYVALQILKYGFPALFFSLPAAGAMLITAQVFRKWFPYVIYRHAGRLERHFPWRLLRLMVFVILWLLLLSDQFSVGYLLHGLGIATFLWFRSRSQLKAAVVNVQHVGDDTWSRSSK